MNATILYKSACLCYYEYMLKQIIKGEKLIPIKFHGNVKHIIFGCNVCGKEFIKPVSYYKKQSKMRPHACCFCSPICRSKYLYEHKNIPASQPEKETQAVKETPKAAAESSPTPKKKGFISQFLRGFLNSK
jgi:hypothetical protein